MNEPCPSEEELVAAATEDPGASNVQLHLADCEACRRRLEQLRAEVGAVRSFSRFSIDAGEIATTRSGASSRDTSPDAAPPALDRVGRYIVVGQLGSGGQADVYRVIDPDLARPLVLKLSRRASAENEAHRSAAMAEGRLLASLSHPGLLHVFDVGVFEGRPFLVLEYVPGRNLEQCYASERLSPAEAARLIKPIAEVLAYAHSHGVVHGDVTPRNIMIDAEGRPRLIDSGLARLEHIWRDSSGSPGGTPEFLPPELAAPGSARYVGPAGDIFGLAATFYWLVARRGPFAAATVVESLERARRGEIDFAALRAAHMPRRLLLWCEAALATAPARRPSAAQCAERLRPPTLSGMRGKAAAMIVLLAALIVVEAGAWLSRNSLLPWSRDHRTVVLSVPEVLVIRDNEVVNLSTVLPLRTGDRLTAAFVVAPGEEVTTVWFDAAGQVHRLKTARTPADEVERVLYPDSARPASVKSPEGTDMLFVCRGAAISDEALRACFPDEPPPPIPDQVLLQLQRLGRIETMGPLPPRSQAAAEVARAEDYIKQIDERLRRHFDGVRAVVFPHRKALETAAQ